METKCNNDGPVAIAESMNNVTNISNHYNVTSAGPTNARISSIVPPTKISFKPLPEPHGAFIGRVKYVQSAVKYLSHPVAADVQIKFPCMVIHALGGYGKTETARKIVSRCRKKRKFQHFIWIDSEDDEIIKKCFFEPMNEIGLAASDKNVDSLLHQFYKLLLSRTNEKFLIVFDNVEDFDLVLKYLPMNYRASNFAVLMTSQRPFTRESYGKVKNKRLDLMPEEEAIKLVENILGRSSMDFEHDKKLLVERSGRITLLLRVMATTINFQRKTKRDYKIEQYLEEMSDQPAQYSDESNALELNYEKSLQKIVRLAVDKLKAASGPIGQIAVKIFDRLAYCSSTNRLTTDFVYSYFWDICEETKNVDMTLPIKPTDDLQIIRMAIEKLFEFSLAHLDDYDLYMFSVHRWIQASRRLDLKESGDERKVLKELLFIMQHGDGNTVSIWQHAADYADIVNKFYAKKRTFWQFPKHDIDLLEKIIRGLTPPADPDELKHFNSEFHYFIRHHIGGSVHKIKRIVNASNYDVSKKSRDYFEEAIHQRNLDVIKWLINEKACIPEVSHLCHCFRIANIKVLNPERLTKLKELNITSGERAENNCGMNLWERFYTAALNKLKAPRLTRISRCIESQEMSYILSALDDLDPFKIGLCEIIEKSCGKNVLNYILHSETHELTTGSIRRVKYCIDTFGIITAVSLALKKLEPTAELSEILETYSKRNLLECLYICGRPHPSVEDEIPTASSRLHKAAWRAAIRSMDIDLIEDRTRRGRTSIMRNGENFSNEDAVVFLERYSAKVNGRAINTRTPLSYAIQYESPSMVEHLLQHGAKTYWDTTFGVKEYALHEAVKFYCHYDSFESEEIIESVLTSSDCQVSATDLDGNNVLHLLVTYYYATCCESNHRVLKLILLANSTLVNMENNDGLTAHQLAKTIQARFNDSHWHAKNLASFISEIDKVLSCENIS